MAFLTAIIECLTGSGSTAPSTTLPPHDLDSKRHPSPTQADLIAAEFISVLTTADKTGPSLRRRLESTADTASWTESLARAVLNGVVDVIQEGREKMGPAMAEALGRVEDEAGRAFEWGTDHPKEVLAGLVVIVAVGVLVVMMAPWVVEALGFAELGPVEGMYPLPLTSFPNPPPVRKQIFFLMFGA